MNKTTRILVVDDEPVILDFFSMILRSAGYEVWEASNGQQCLQMTRERRPDLVLLDIMLPDLSGIDVCRQIKADGALLDVFVVLVSGKATSAADKVDGAEIGADDYIVKPVNTDEFLARIRTIVRLRDTTASLRASEQHYRRLVEILPDAVGVIDLQGRLTTANRQAMEMLGYAGPEELLGKSAFDLTPPEEHERLQTDIATTLEAGVMRNAAYTAIRKNGSRFPVELSAGVSTDADGQSRGIVIVARDITARQEAEAHLRLQSAVLEAAANAIVITDRAGDVMWVNPAFTHLTGYLAKEVVGQNPRLLKSGQHDQVFYKNLWETVLAGRVWRSEMVNRRKDGSLYSEEMVITPMRTESEGITHFIAVKQDITERKQAERSLRASEERFRQLADNIREVFWMSDPAKVEVIYVSPAYEEIWGQTCESLYASPRNWVEALHPDDRERVLEAALTKQVSGQYDEIYRIVRPDGAIRWIQDRGFPVRDGSGKVYRIVGIAEDITQRKEAEIALRNAESRHRSIFENATEGIFRTTPEGRILVANPALARMFGYQSPQEMMTSVTDVATQIYVSPEKRAEMNRLLLQQGAVQGFEEENYRKDGSKIWVSLNAHLIRDASGAAQYFEGTIQDITERKWAEKFLQTQRDFGTFLSSSIGLNATVMQLLEIVLQNEGIDCGGVFLVDPETGALDLVAHRGFSADFAKRASHFAMDPTPVRSAGMSRAISRQPAGPLTGIVEQLKRESLLAMEVIPVQHNREVVAVLSVGSHVGGEIPVKLCQAMGAIATQAAGAITRIRAEQSLRANRRLLEKTLHSLRSAVFVVNADTMVIEECNPAATQIFGYTRDELIGLTTASLHENEAMAEQFASRLHSAVEDKGFLSDFEFKMRRKDGTVFPTEQSMMPIRNEVGRLVSWVGVVQDITERKRVGEELRQLPWRIIEAQETERLRVARELHDGVNQVIASVKMRLREVENRVATLNPAAKEILARCDKLLVRALEENRRIAHNLRPSDLDELGLAAACRNFCKEIQARTNLTVKCNIAPLGQRLLPAAELNLFRIVQEALTNVEKHAQAQTVRLRLSFQGNSAVLRIQDDGRGFAPQRSKARKGKWRGIGLTNIRERSLSLGGTCEVLSTPKQGTTISVRIPCKQAG